VSQRKKNLYKADNSQKEKYKQTKALHYWKSQILPLKSILLYMVVQKPIHSLKDNPDNVRRR